MDPLDQVAKGLMGVFEFGNASACASDVVVKLRTPEGRDDRFYTLSGSLRGKCKHFDTCLSALDGVAATVDSKRCLELVCAESEVDFYVILLRLLHAKEDEEVGDVCYNVRNAIGVVKLASRLGCDEIVERCVRYVESMPWDESEEEDILKTLPPLGSRMLSVLARLHPVNPALLRQVFLSALAVATREDTSSSMIAAFPKLRRSAQEQVEYMLVEDDDAPLIIADAHVKSEFRDKFRRLFDRFQACLTTSAQASELDMETEVLFEKLLDLEWAARVLPKVNLLQEMVAAWLGCSQEIIGLLNSLNNSCCATKLKVMEITCKILEAVGYGNVVTPPNQRTELVKVWLPFIRGTKPLLEVELQLNEIEGELFQNIESAITSLILALPSDDQAEILSDWLKADKAGYPDLSEAFEVWCFRSKVAKRRLIGLVSPC